ncbi:hypothetical protein [Streptomyces radicis]|uniref:hypothetical protein n=1 Tax=Streptomyces radicis TaxID=1750517 RepID=UPI001E3B3629|nr:hypothetical protein [Streptomyces radicis]
MGNVTWVLGADRDIPALAGVTGPGAFGAAVVGRALHWMDADALFATLRPLCRGVAVLDGGTPLWLQDTAWSRALRGVIEERHGGPLTATCGTSAEDRARYAAALVRAGYTGVREVAVVRRAELDAAWLIGEVCSAMSPGTLPAPAERAAFEDRVRRALPGPGPYREEVPLTALLGRSAPRAPRP